MAQTHHHHQAATLTQIRIPAKILAKTPAKIQPQAMTPWAATKKNQAMATPAMSSAAAKAARRLRSPRCCSSPSPGLPAAPPAGPLAKPDKFCYVGAWK